MSFEFNPRRDILLPNQPLQAKEGKIYRSEKGAPNPDELKQVLNAVNAVAKTVMDTHDLGAISSLVKNLAVLKTQAESLNTQAAKAWGPWLRRAQPETIDLSATESMLQSLKNLPERYLAELKSRYQALKDTPPHEVTKESVEKVIQLSIEQQIALQEKSFPSVLQEEYVKLGADLGELKNLLSLQRDYNELPKDKNYSLETFESLHEKLGKIKSDLDPNFHSQLMEEVDKRLYEYQHAEIEELTEILKSLDNSKEGLRKALDVDKRVRFLSSQDSSLSRASEIQGLKGNLFVKEMEILLSLINAQAVSSNDLTSLLGETHELLDVYESLQGSLIGSTHKELTDKVKDKLQKALSRADNFKATQEIVDLAQRSQSYEIEDAAMGVHKKYQDETLMHQKYHYLIKRELLQDPANSLDGFMNYLQEHVQLVQEISNFLFQAKDFLSEEEKVSLQAKLKTLEVSKKEYVKKAGKVFQEGWRTFHEFVMNTQDIKDFEEVNKIRNHLKTLLPFIENNSHEKIQLEETERYLTYAKTLISLEEEVKAFINSTELSYSTLFTLRQNIAAFENTKVKGYGFPGWVDQRLWAIKNQISKY